MATRQKRDRLALQNANRTSTFLAVMAPSNESHKLPFYQRIIFLLVLPVFVVGILIAWQLIVFFTPQMEAHLNRNFQANLRLAASLGVGVCETYFNQLLDMRLEDNAEMNDALQKEALTAIKTIGTQVPGVHILVLEDKQAIQAISVEYPRDVWKLPPLEGREGKLNDVRLGAEPIRAQVRYFPFWDWHIISFVYVKDIQAPMMTARRSVVISTIVLLAAVFIVLLLMFRYALTKPLNRLILATQNVAAGKLLQVDPIRKNEIGQLMTFFNTMVASLKMKTQEVQNLIDRLRESESRYKSLVELSPDAVFVHQDGIIRYINPKGVKMFGADHSQELIGQGLMKFIHPRYYEQVNARINEVCTEQTTLHPAEFQYLTTDGQTFSAEGTATYIEYAGVPAVLSVVRDVSDRIRAETALREREEQLSSVFRIAPTGIGVVVNRMFKQVNARVCEMTGYARKDLVGQNARILYPTDEDYEYVGREKYRQISEHGTGTVETRWQTKDGRILDVLLSSTPMDLNDLSRGVTFTALDITERKRTRKALRISHERFLTVMESIDATIYVADMDTHEVLFMNKNMIESFGGDMTGQLCWEAFRGSDGPCPHCTNDQLVDDSGQPKDVCIWQGKNPLTGKWYINHDRAIQWTDGRLVRLQIATDITDLKRMEQQIQQTQKFEAIGTLAGGIAHDFNNILMGIQGRASLVAVDLESSSEYLEHVKAIETYIRQATDLTRQLLGLAKGGKYEVKPTEINELVSNSASMFGRTKKEIRIHTRFQDPSPVVAVDRGQIEQVLLNLYINAWQAMPAGGELYLATQLVDLDAAFCQPYNIAPGRYVKLSVTDTGIGMDEDTSQQIFDPFFTTKKKGRGTGLGLASVYGIINNHDGFIVVNSEVDIGTTFNIHLPLTDKKALPEASATGDLINGTETVLLVDDEEMIRDVGQAMLEKLGYRLFMAASGEQALHLIKHNGHEIDLVILDLIMPGLDGGKTFDLIKEIRPNLPVILASGYAIDGQANEIIKKGCNGFIQKPYNIADLSQKVREVLDADNSRVS